MSWRVARSLLVLRAEIDKLAPDRSKASDGTIGDPAHSSRVSDHNPNPKGVVCAHDFTHDPTHGADMAKISEALRKSRHPALKYLIFRGRIASAKSSPPWSWRAYTGANRHDKHVHVSVGGDYDDQRTWGVAAALKPPVKKATPVKPRTNFEPGARTLSRGDRGDDVRFVQRWVGIEQTGRFGERTERAVKQYQRMRGLRPDGIVGPRTWRPMLRG